MSRDHSAICAFDGATCARQGAAEWLRERQQRCDRVALQPPDSGGLDDHLRREQFEHPHRRGIRRPMMRHLRDRDSAGQVVDLIGHRIATMAREVATHQRARGVPALTLDLHKHGDATCILRCATLALAAGGRWRRAGRSRSDRRRCLIDRNVTRRPQHPHMHVWTDRERIALPDRGHSASRITGVTKQRGHRSPWRLPRALERIEAHKQPPHAHGLDHLRHSAVVVEVRVRHDDRVDAAHTERVKCRHDRAAAERG